MGVMWRRHPSGLLKASFTHLAKLIDAFNSNLVDILFFIVKLEVILISIEVREYKKIQWPKEPLLKLVSWFCWNILIK